MYKNRKRKRSVLTSVNENTSLRTRTEPVVEDDVILSQESIPPSQPTTQRRYLSQRTIRSQPSVLLKSRKSYYENVLIDAGADVDNSECFILSCHQITFVKKLGEILKNHQNYPDNLTQFLEPFKNAMDSNSNALKLLSGCKITIGTNDTCMLSQDSIVINFLMIDFLQTEVIHILIDKVASLALNETDTTEIPLIPLILIQMKYVATHHSEFLYTKLIEIYESANSQHKKEIIGNAEFVLDPIKHDEFVEYLIENSSSNKDLLSSHNIQVFENLYLSSNILKRLTINIMNYMTTDCDLSAFPMLIDFLLKNVNECDSELILKLRDCLNWHKQFENGETIQTTVFSHIEQSLKRSKKIFDLWLKLIQNLGAKAFRPFDCIILLIMMSIRDERADYIENIIRRRIKLEQFTAIMFTKMCKEFVKVVEKFSDIILTMLNKFLREKDYLVSNFANHGYRMLFESNNICQKKVINKLVELTCDKSASNITTLALEVLKCLNIKHVDCGLLLLPILDLVHDLNLSQFRIVMQLLCSIAYPLVSVSQYQVLEDHIDMMVKKQIINKDTLIKKQGIIGMVQIIIHLIETEESNNSEQVLDISFSCVDEMPDGKGKLSADLIEQILSATKYCPNCLAFFYDEMANELKKTKQLNNINYIDKNFLVWLSDLVSTYFIKYFIVEETPSHPILNLSYQKGRNDEIKEKNAINISGIVLNSSSDANLSIKTLAPLFNLLRTLQFIRYNGSLTYIDAVVGSSIILPAFMETDDNHDILDEYDEEIIEKILQIYFYTINWFRAIVGSFASQNNELLRKTVLFRLSELIKLESTIRILIAKSSTDSSPTKNPFGILCEDIFKKPHGNKRAGTSKQKKRGNIESSKSENTLIPARKTNFVDYDGQYEGFRQMDPDIMLLLRENLILKITLNDQIGESIGFLEFKYILSDLINKLESLPTSKKFLLEKVLPYILNPADLINDVIKFLPVIFKCFNQFSDMLKLELVEVNGSLGHENLFTDDLNYCKECFNLCLRLFEELLSWSGFDEDCNFNLLKELLNAFLTNPNMDIDQNDNISTTATIVYEYFLKIEPNVLDIKSAVSLYFFLVSLKKFINEDVVLDKPIGNLCKIFLSRTWYGFDGTIEKGAGCNVFLNDLINGFVKDLNFESLKQILNLILVELQYLEGKNQFLRIFPNINKANLPMLFKSLCESFINIITEGAHTSVSNMTGLNFWEQGSEMNNLLLDFVKSIDIPRNYAIYLKYAHIFIKLFLQHGMEIIENCVKNSPQRVGQFLEKLRISMRFLHHLCCHYKTIKNTAVVTQIPVLRQTIEKLIYRIKGALALNNCSSVFTMGNLINRDIYGEEILSQSSSLVIDQEDEDIPDDSNIDISELSSRSICF